MNITLTVRELLVADGNAPWLTYHKWDDLVYTADAITNTITLPIRRVAFIAEAAETLRSLPPSTITDEILDVARWAREAAESAKPTPCGSTELWGTIVQIMEE